MSVMDDNNKMISTSNVDRFGYVNYKIINSFTNRFSEELNLNWFSNLRLYYNV